MRSGVLSRQAILCWLVATSLAPGLGLANAAPRGDISDAAAKATLGRMKRKYGFDLPFFAQVLYSVPVLKAPSAFLAEHGSSVGIYYRGRVYVSEGLLRADGTIDVDSGTSLAIIIHESWHAYYELLMPEPQKTALTQEFRSYYNRSGSYPEEEWICFGDESIGNYYADLVAAYAFVVRKFLQARTLPDGTLKLYTNSFHAEQLYGYGTDGSIAPFPISPHERSAARQIASGAFPPPEQLSEELERRFPAPSPISAMKP